MNLPIEILHADCDARFWRGRVQSHGRLLAFSEENLRLVSWSGTWPRPLATDDELEDVIGMQAAHALRNLLAKTGSTPSPGILSGVELSGEEQSFDVFIHRYSGHVIVELEEATAGESLIQSAIDPAQALARRLQASMSAERMAATATRIAGALLGYDRALLYRVSNTGEARIMAETLRAGSRLGSLADSAPLAEAVFLAGNPPLPAIRMIADTGSETMPMMPDGMANEQPDLAHAQLRCLLPEHAAALARHGIAASLIVPLMGENGLWGALSCHHPSPRRLTAPERAGLELFGRILALQLTEAERRDARLREEEARQQLRQMTLEIRQEARAADMPSMHAHVPALATLLRADGVAYGESGRWLAHGATPDMHGLEQITALSDSTGDIYETNDLAGLGQPLGRADLRALLIVPLSLSPRRHLIFFRVAGPAGVTGQRGPFCREDRAIARVIAGELKGAFADIAEFQRDRRALQERRRRLIQDELNHRIKNIITLILSIARQTGVHAASVPDFSATLEGRLQALSRAHDQSISGASSRSLARIVESEAVLYRPQRQPDRLRVHGPEIALDERASGAVALVIHEMMTNAAKYGALSTPGGTLGVSWTIRDDGSCAIEWLERGGPTVSEPSAQGFGTKLIASCMEYDLGGEADMRFVPDGLQATLVIPAAYVVAEVPRDTVLEETSAQNADLSGSHILVVEDQALIAMEIEDTLRAMGATVTLAAHVRDALGVLDQATPNLALLDFNLGQGTSEEIAVRLSDLGIPFLFATGYGDRLVIPERFQDTPIIGKPFEGRELGRAILQVLKRPAI